MFKLLALSLAIACWAGGSQAQTCGPCAESCNEGQCCQWDNPPVDKNPNSFNEMNGTPLGFVLAFLPRVESVDPKPCVRVDLNVPSSQTYMQVAVESSTTICVHEGDEDAATCGMAFFYCNTDGYLNDNSVTFFFDCMSCPASETSFRYRVEMQTVGQDDEFWCQNANTTLPSDLFQDMNTAFVPPDITPSTFATEAAPAMLITPALLLVSMLIATLLV